MKEEEIGISRFYVPETFPLFKFQGVSIDDSFFQNLLDIRKIYLTGKYKKELDHFFDKLKLEYIDKNLKL